MAVPIVKDIHNPYLCPITYQSGYCNLFELFRQYLCSLAPVCAVKFACVSPATITPLLSSPLADRSEEDCEGKVEEAHLSGSRRRGSASGTRVAWPDCQRLERTLWAISPRKRTSGTS